MEENWLDREDSLEFVKSFFEIVWFAPPFLFIYLFFFLSGGRLFERMDSEFVEEFSYDPGISSRWNI